MTVSINGVFLKVKNTQKDHDGQDIISADLYVGRKRVGFYQEDDFGAPPLLSFRDKDSENLFNEKRKAYFEARPATYSDNDDFIEELIRLSFLEKVYEDNKALGYPVTAFFGFKGRDYDFTVDRPLKPDVFCAFASTKDLNNAIKQDSPLEVLIAKSKNSFKITI